MTVSLIDVSTYLPGEPIGADYYAQFAESDDLRDNVMFRAPKFRHHVAEDETAIDMVERAAAGLIERHGQDTIANVDVLIASLSAQQVTGRSMWRQPEPPGGQCHSGRFGAARISSSSWLIARRGHLTAACSRRHFVTISWLEVATWGTCSKRPSDR